MRVSTTVVLRDRQGIEHTVSIAADLALVDGHAVDVHLGSGGARVAADGRTARAWAVRAADTVWVFMDGDVATFQVGRADAARRARPAHGSLTAPMPATVRQVAVAPGDVVTPGDILIVLEAMKMELPVRAPAAGRIAAVKCRQGDLVEAGQELVELTP
jgi:3-methylcrotonyl-CoA carboxylase alpha subunit